jgi:competence protein ComEA
MIHSLLVKVAMLAMTMGLVFWIGWQAPQTVGQDAEPEGPLPAAADPPPQDKAVGDEKRPTASVTRVAARPPVQTLPPGPSRPQKPLDLNRATAAEIESLPGIGPVLAQRVIDYRSSAGGFRGVDDLRHVKGIGAKKFERVRPLVMVAAPAEEKKTTETHR